MLIIAMNVIIFLLIGLCSIFRHKVLAENARQRQQVAMHRASDPPVVPIIYNPGQMSSANDDQQRPPIRVGSLFPLRTGQHPPPYPADSQTVVQMDAPPSYEEAMANPQTSVASNVIRKYENDSREAENGGRF